jgi:hypothetical protein
LIFDLLYLLGCGVSSAEWFWLVQVRDENESPGDRERIILISIY